MCTWLVRLLTDWSLHSKWGQPSFLYFLVSLISGGWHYFRSKTITKNSNFWCILSNYMQLHKQFLQLGITNLLLLLITLYALYNHSFEMMLASALMLLVSLAPFYLKAAHNVYIPAVFMYIVIAFIFASIFLGQFGGLYDRLHWYDAFLHFISALAFGLVGFLLLFVFYVHNKLKLPKSVILFFTFFFCLGVGALWEIIEYGIDYVLGTNMQVNSLDDTMVDLLFGGLGATVTVTLLGIYMSKMNAPIIDEAMHTMTEEIIKENKVVAKTSINDTEPASRS